MNNTLDSFNITNTVDYLDQLYADGTGNEYLTLIATQLEQFVKASTDCEIQSVENLVERQYLNEVYMHVNYSDIYRVTKLSYKRPIQKVADIAKLRQALESTDADYYLDRTDEQLLQDYYQSIVRIYDYELNFDFNEVEPQHHNRLEQSLSHYKADDMNYWLSLNEQQTYYWFDELNTSIEFLAADEYVQAVMPEEFYIKLPSLMREALECAIPNKFAGRGDNSYSEAWQIAIKNCLARCLDKTLPIIFK